MANTFIVNLKKKFSAFTEFSQIATLSNSTNYQDGVTGEVIPDLIVCNRICSVGHLMVDPMASDEFAKADNGPPKGIIFNIYYYLFMFYLY